MANSKRRRSDKHSELLLWRSHEGVAAPQWRPRNVKSDESASCQTSKSETLQVL